MKPLLASLLFLIAFTPSLPAADLPEAVQKQTKFISAVEGMLADKGTVEIISLDPQMAKQPFTPPDEAAADKFHGYPILGRLKVEDANERTDLMNALAQSAHESPAGVGMRCFQPRHGIIHTVGDQKTELLICFECLQVRVYSPAAKEPWGANLTKTASTAFDAFLDKHQIKRDMTAKKDEPAKEEPAKEEPAKKAE